VDPKGTHTPDVETRRPVGRVASLPQLALRILVASPEHRRRVWVGDLAEKHQRPAHLDCRPWPARDGRATRANQARGHARAIGLLGVSPKGASRDELIEAIWPAQDPERTRPRFWQSVTEARKALGDAWVHHGERYELDRSKVRVDLDDLDRLLAASNGATDDPTALESALALWRGEPLEGSDYLWAEGELRVLHATLVDLLERVGRSRLGRDDARGALQMADQAIALDGLHEPSWRLAFQAEHALGLRESITRRFDELTRSLDEQLGLEPARETRLVYRQLLGQS